MGNGRLDRRNGPGPMGFIRRILSPASHSGKIAAVIRGAHLVVFRLPRWLLWLVLLWLVCRAVSGVCLGQHHTSICRVTAHGTGSSSHGTGVLLAPDLVLTNAHVVRDSTGRVVTKFPGESEQPASIIKVDTLWDLCALRVSTKASGVVIGQPIAPALGQPVYILGVAGGDGLPRRVLGVMHTLSAPSPGSRHGLFAVKTSAGIRAGDSGGGIFSMDGALVGILFGAVDGEAYGTLYREVSKFIHGTSVPIPLAATTAANGTARTENFVVSASSAAFAQQIAEAAELSRATIANEWVGKVFPKWAAPCTIIVKDGPSLGAGGNTTFMFNAGHAYGWKMFIQGTQERLLDSVVPHEVAHTVLATHFRQPIPRWIDEGMCTTLEAPEEKGRMLGILNNALRSGRGIAFGVMMNSFEYPNDIMPLYAQGHSLCRFLMNSSGDQKSLIAFIEDGLTSSWKQAVTKHYGYMDLQALQDAWLQWVRDGSPVRVTNYPPSCDSCGGWVGTPTGPTPPTGPGCTCTPGETKRLNDLVINYKAWVKHVKELHIQIEQLRGKAGGENGRDGVDGANGNDGRDGHTGTKGDRGVDGTRGQPGTAGRRGDQGVPGERGAAGMKGDNGLNGVVDYDELVKRIIGDLPPIRFEYWDRQEDGTDVFLDSEEVPLGGTLPIINFDPAKKD